MTSRPNKSKQRRGTVTKCVETSELLAIIEVPVVFYESEPKEPYLEPKTVKFLDEFRRRTKAGDKAWLRKHGAKLYVGSSAA